MRPINNLSPEVIEKYDDLLRQARYKVRMHLPYFYSSLMAMRFFITDQAKLPPTEDEPDGTPTFMVDQYFRMYAHPDFIDRMMQEAESVSAKKPCPCCGKTSHHKLAYISGIMLHEMYHPLRKHFARTISKFGANYDPRYRSLINICQDLEINDGLLEGVKLAKADDVCLPEETLLPSKVGLENDLFWEEYFDVLIQHPHKTEGQGEKSCGSGADGMKMPFEEPGEGEAGFDGVGEAENDALQRKVAQDVKEYAKQNPGTVPGGLTRWADKYLEPPKVNWREKLRSFIRYCSKQNTSGHKRTTFARSSVLSRVMEHKVITPTYVAPVPEVTIIIDTSGSMSQKALKEALSETQGVIDAIKAKCKIICCDAEARVVGSTKRATSVNLVGGGGTILAKGIELALSDRRNKPNVIVVLTDGYDCFQMQRPVGTKVVVCLVGEAPTTQYIPDWMLVCRVDDLETDTKKEKRRR